MRWTMGTIKSPETIQEEEIFNASKKQKHSHGEPCCKKNATLEFL
jgi:hypothetical protein